MSFARASFLLAQNGQEFTSQDWSDRVGVLIGAIIVVLIVNGIGLYFIRRPDDDARPAGTVGDDHLDLRQNRSEAAEAQS